MGKKIYALFVYMVLAMCLSGCSVASEKEIIRYAKEKYGEATHIKTEKVSDDNTRCYLRDKEYGFEYYVSSYMNDIIIDGANFGASENKGSDFDVKYYNYMNDAIKEELSLIEEKYNVDIVISDGTYIYYFAKVNYQASDSSNVALVTKEISDLYTSLDTRHYWKDLDVEAYDNKGNYLGAYHYEQGRWMTPEDEEDLIFIDNIENLSDKALYIRKEQHYFTETGVNINDVVQVLGNPEVKTDSKVTYYIFTVDGKEYYMCNFMVMNEIGGYEWYTNYND